MDYIQDIRRSKDLPYPNLIRRYAAVDQGCYLLEPKNPSQKGGAGKRIQTHEESTRERDVMFCYKSFGSLSRVYEKKREDGGSHYFVFCRRNRGTFDHGLARADEDTYECGKMNILRHPLKDGVNSPAYRFKSPRPVRGLEKAMLCLANYPSIPDTVMMAPLFPRYGPKFGTASAAPMKGHFSKPQHKQPVAMTKVFCIPELRMELMLQLGHRWGDLSNLSRTCQMVMFALSDTFTRVNLTRGNFVNLNFTDDEIDAANAKATAEQLKMGGFSKPLSPAFLILSGCRPLYKAPENGEGQSYGSDPLARPKGAFYQPTAERRIIDTFRMMKTFQVRGAHIKFMHFHSVPNLDIPLLRKCLQKLPNLEVLGVYNCELLHFGQTVPFLKMVIEHNRMPWNQLLRSDFSPVYYPGPHVTSDGRRGEFGVIASDQGLIDTPRAIAAVLRTAIPLALFNGIDWFTPGTGMRQYLERIPFALGSLRYILEAHYNIYDLEMGRHHPPSNASQGQYNDQVWYDHMCRAVYSDLIIAVEGRAMSQDKLTSLLTLGGKFHNMMCAFCQSEMPAYFFTEESVGRKGDQIQCCGCQLVSQLDLHIDNFFQEKKMTMHILFDDLRIDDIDSFLSAKRIAAEEEIRNPQFDFWLLSVKSKEEIKAGGPSGTGYYPLSYVLDGRPGPGYPTEGKKIWVWKERVARAMHYAKFNIDEGFTKAQAAIADCRRKIEVLDEQYYNGALRNASQRRTNRDKVDQLDRFILQERARCGQGQMTGKFHTAAAADWNKVIHDYRERVQIYAGALQNNGPRHLYAGKNGFFS